MAAEKLGLKIDRTSSNEASGEGDALDGVLGYSFLHKRFLASAQP